MTRGAQTNKSITYGPYYETGEGNRQRGGGVRESRWSGREMKNTRQHLNIELHFIVLLLTTAIFTPPLPPRG